MATVESQGHSIFVRCARVVAISVAIVFAAHGATLAVGYLTGCLFRSGPRWLHAATYHETLTVSMAACIALSGLFHMSVAWRLWMFARLIERSPGPAIRRLAKAAWIYAVLRGIVGVWSEIAQASYDHLQARAVSQQGSAVMDAISDPTRAVWLVMHMLAGVLSVWVARVATASAKAIEGRKARVNGGA